jgi:hypothetical protein
VRGFPPSKAHLDFDFVTLLEEPPRGTHPEVARDQIQRIAQGVSDIAIVERAPSLEGRTMFAILARGRGKGEDAPRPAPVAANTASAPSRASGSRGAAPANPPQTTPPAAGSNGTQPTA